MNANRQKLTRRFLVAALLLAGAAIGRAQTLISDSFARPDGLVTNEWAFWNPASALAKKDATWEMDSGSFFAQGGAGWTGRPDGTGPNAGSTNGTHSSIFRLNTKRADVGDAQVSFELLNQGLSASAGVPPQDWDGCHIWLRYQSEYKLYYASINRRDGTSIIKKKVPGGPSNGGAYYNLSASVSHPVRYNQWQSVKVTVQDNSDGSVSISLYADGALVVQARDDGSVGGAPIRGAGRIGLRGDNADLKFRNFVVSSLGSAATAATAAAASPSVSVTAPTAGAAVSGIYNLTVRVGGARIAGVQYQIDGVNVGPEVTASPFTQTWYSNLGVNGPHAVRAVARSVTGQTATSSPVTFTLTGARPGVEPPKPAAQPLMVAVINPISGKFVSGIVTLKVNVGGGTGVAGVQYLIDGAPLTGEVTAAPFSLDWYSAGGIDGPHTLTAIARDAAGNKTTSAPIPFTLTGGRPPLGGAPAVPAIAAPAMATVASPAAGATVSGIVTLAVSAGANTGVAGVQWQADGVDLGSEVRSAPFTLAWHSYTGTNGTHTLRAVVRDAAGRKTTSAPVTIKLAGARAG